MVAPQSAMVVSTKVSRPRVARVIARPRVSERIAEAHEHPLTWLHGGPGSGKTVALAEFVRGARPAPLWLQIDEGDADVALFFAGLAAAAQRAWPRRRFALPKLHPEQQVGGLGPYARRFFEALVGRSKRPLFVLDDYHHLPADSAVHEAVLAALDVLGEGGRLIVASRTPPPPAFARVRMAGAVAVLEPSTFRFDRDELGALATLRTSTPLPPQELDAMMELTDGWAAGLTVAIESGGLADAEAAELGRDTLFGYFMTEVLRGLDERTVHVLLSTACLRQVTVSLAVKLSGDDEAGEHLAALQRRALFVTRDTKSATTYRVHDLFRDFLAAECRRRMDADAFRALQVRAANALIGAGDTEQGADLLVQAQAWEDLANLVLGGAAMVLLSGRFQSLSRWIDALPRDVVESRPWLTYWRGLSYLLSAPGVAREVLDPVLDAFAEAGDDLGYCLAYSALATAILAERHDMRHQDRLIDHLYSRLDGGWSFPFDHAEAHVASAIALALSFRAPDHPDLDRWRERARELEVLLPTTDLRAIALLRVGLSAMWGGNFPLATKSVASMRELTSGDDEPSPFHTGAVISVEQYVGLYTRPTTCRDARDRGLAEAAHFGLDLWSPTLKLHDVAASLSLGRLDEAEALLGELATEVQVATRVERGYYSELRAWQSLLEGDYDTALHFAEDAARIGQAYGARLPFLSSSYAIALAAHGAGDDERAMTTIDMIAEKSGAIRFLAFQADLARAELHLAAGREAAAIEALERALPFGRKVGCYNFIHWRSEPLTPLLCLALREGIEVPYVQQLVRRHAITTEVPPRVSASWPFPLRIRTLGALQIVGDPDAGVVPTGAVRGVRLRLMAELIAAPSEGVTLRRLADDLWPDADGDRAMQSLHTTLHRLRKALGCDDAVVVEAGFARLDRRLCSVDAWQLADAATAADASRADLEAAHALGDALFLDGVDLEAHALGYRHTLRDAARRVAERLIAAG